MESINKELENFPEELIAQLSKKYKRGGRAVSKVIFEIINERGIATTDEIIIDFYRKTSQVLKRTHASTEASRLVTNGLVFKEDIGTFKSKIETKNGISK